MSDDPALSSSRKTILIIGAGIVGATAALVLDQVFSRYGQDYKIEIWDRQDRHTLLKKGSRLLAVNAGSESLWTTLGVWSQMDPQEYGYYQAMRVWESEGFGVLEWRAKDHGLAALGAMVPEKTVLKALYTAIDQQAQRISWTVLPEGALEESLSSRTQRARYPLIIAADGGSSPMRRFCQSSVQERCYDQEAIVASVYADRPHQGRALQCYTATQGIVALLPSADPCRYGLVWSVPRPLFKSLSEQGLDQRLLPQIYQAMQGVCGPLSGLDDLAHYPLMYRLIDRFLSESVLFLGDAAHSAHVHAGLNNNLAMKALSCLQEALNASQGVLSPYVLEHYARRARGEIVPLLKGIDRLAAFYQNSHPFLRRIRSWGGTWMQQQLFLKEFFLKQAMMYTPSHGVLRMMNE